MPTTKATLLLLYIQRWLRVRLAVLRSSTDAGSHATEYAIGIGLSAAIAILLWGAYRNGIDAITSNWFFGDGD